MALTLVYSIPAGGAAIDLGLSGSLSVTVNWGDGITDTSTSHTYTNVVATDYSVSVTGTATKFNNLSSQGIEYLTQCTSFGSIGLTDLSYAFYNASSLTVVPTSLPTTSTVTRMNAMFYDATSFNQDISGWNISAVEIIAGIFQGAIAFNQDISNWNTSSVISMANIFKGATSFNQDIGKWDVSAVRVLNLEEFKTPKSYLFEPGESEVAALVLDVLELGLADLGHIHG
jgi:surface protein